ncbi:MAG: twin-arginine translocase TatA/TatE family subunit [Muribaculaceae bacterium]|nr:twin-arginine translocase TatA/TatE family subunit [Muribaculaceae bacterium]MBR0025339.1 twin-arginine translocase TatA/TatE family subunit [Muribaculaceae bacterium]
MIGTTELLLVAGLALLLFGGKKLPEMMKGMGQGVKSFKEGLNSPVEEPQQEEATDEAALKEQTVETQEAEQNPEQ